MTKEEAIALLKDGGVIRHKALHSPNDYIAGWVEATDTMPSQSCYYDDTTEGVCHVYPVSLDNFPDDEWEEVE